MDGKGKIIGASAPGAERPPGRKTRLRQQPARSAKGCEEAAEREKRLAAALRANLRKRKAQLMARRPDSSDSRARAAPSDAKRR